MYVRKVGDRELTFQVSGKLWMRSLIMSDVETGSEWSHLLGQSMAGELKGRTLQALNTDMVTWEVWRNRHPDTTVLNMSRTSREYSSEFYRDPTKFVYGFEWQGGHYALPMEKMLQRSVHQFELAGRLFVATFDRDGAATYLFDAKLGDKRLEFQRVDDKLMRDVQTGSHWTIATGQAIDGEYKNARLTQLVGIMSYRSAWINFHPDSKDIEF